MKCLRASGALLLAIGLLTACGATGDPKGSGSNPGALAALLPPAKPWPETFGREAFLLADQIVIKGPYGLLEHVALGRDPESLDYSAKTIPEGFRQILKRKDPRNYVEIRCQLDNWTLVALDSILVLESAAGGEVQVVAAGNAVWRSTDELGPLSGDQEQRADKLVFRGGE
jgi:hypothetical protein